MKAIDELAKYANESGDNLKFSKFFPFRFWVMLVVGIGSFLLAGFTLVDIYISQDFISRMDDMLIYTVLLVMSIWMLDDAKVTMICNEMDLRIRVLKAKHEVDIERMKHKIAKLESKICRTELEENLTKKD